jgi:hypothetical protein
MRSFLASFLRLVARDVSLPPATIADVLLFAAGEKPALRFAVPPSTRAQLDAWAEGAGLAGAREAVSASPRGQGWIAIEPRADGDAPCSSASELVVYARSAALAEEIRDRELAGDPEGAGGLLGYPACCVIAYAEATTASSSPSAWIGAAVERAGEQPPRAFCNRLPIAWSAPTFVGEIYPCSFACDSLTAIGRRVHALMIAAGLEALAARTRTESLRPVRFRPLRPDESAPPAWSAMLPLAVDDPRVPDLLRPQ